MATVLLVPHVLMILDLSLLIQRHRHQTVHFLTNVQQTRSVLLLLFTDDVRRRRFYNFGLDGLRRRKYFFAT